MSKTIEMNTKALDKLIRALGSKIPTARVGVLGAKNARSSEGGSPSNATIGMNHEYGEIVELHGKMVKLPVRSFLRMPLIDHLEEFLEKNGAMDKTTINEVIKSGNFEEFIAKIGITGEEVVAEAFATGGFGQWKKSNMSFKKNKQTLVETQQLRNSITSEVKK